MTEPSWTDSNWIFNATSYRQGVSHGSPEWLAAGIAPHSAQTGPQASYGWNFDHLSNPARIHEVLSRYASHGIFYENALYRNFGGTGSGRPKGWNAAQHGREGVDGPKGHVAFFGVVGDKHKVTQVSGPDVQHAQYRPLLSVIDAPPIMVDTQFGPMESNAVAHILFTYHLRALFGQIRVPGQGDGRDTYDWSHRDRGNAMLLTGMLEGMRRGCLEVDDAATAGRFLEGPFLRVYETGPGADFFAHSRPAPGSLYPVGIYNSLSWIAPVIWDAATHDGFLFPKRLRAIVERQCRWALDLERWALEKGYGSGAGFQGEKFWLPPGLETPPDSIKDLIQGIDGLDGGSTSLRRAWGYRFCALAAELTGAPELAAAEKSIREEHSHDPTMKKWLVGADGEFVG